MKKKNLISLTISFAFLVLSVSGILLWLKQKAHPIEMAHTIFGLLFVSFAIFHIANNWSSITGYSKSKKTGSFQKEFMFAAILAIVLLAGALTEVLEPVAEFGRIFNKSKKTQNSSIQFEVKKTNEKSAGKDIFILVQKKQDDPFSKIAISIQDTTGKIIEQILEANPKAEGPQSNVMIYSKSSAIAPFDIVIGLSNSKEVSQEKFRIISNQMGIQRISLKDNSKLQQVLFEVK